MTPNIHNIHIKLKVLIRLYTIKPMVSILIDYETIRFVY